MTLEIFRHARILVPESLDPRKFQATDDTPKNFSFKPFAKKSVGGIFALSGATLASIVPLTFTTLPLDLGMLFAGSLAGLVATSAPVINSYRDKSGDYIPFKKKTIKPEPVEPVYFEPYRNWDEVFVTYTERLIDKHIECDTPVGFVTVTTQDSAEIYRIQQEKKKGNKNISWDGVYGGIAEENAKSSFRDKYNTETVLFVESQQ